MLNEQIELEAIDRTLRSGSADLALTQCQSMLAAQPQLVEGWLLQARIQQNLSRFHDMLSSASQAHALAPQRIHTRKKLIEALVSCGEISSAKAHLIQFEQTIASVPDSAQDSAMQWHVLAQLYTHCADHGAAARCARRAAALAPDDQGLRYNLAAALFSVGDMQGSEAALKQVIQANPNDGDAHYLRATLRKQEPLNNHITALRHLLDAGALTKQAQVPVHYALGKELEDIGEFDTAFTAFNQAAMLRRSQLSYRVERDIEALALICDTFTENVFRGAPAPTAETERSAVRLFVTGLPRSGTTLVDRILGAHDQVGSLGEINDFAFAMMRVVGQVASKSALISQSAFADHSRIGDEYIYSTAGYGLRQKVLIDKTPLNFLYLGLIHLALPAARIIHVRRHPLDSCFAMFKTLFRMGYPFSYSLDDLAGYYVAYERLMQHWRTVIPHAFIEVDYEQLVMHQEAETLRMLDYCLLPWQAQCLNFHQSNKPSATASGAQVRQPLYRSSVNNWQHYRRQLKPLQEALQKQGIQCE